MPAQWSRLTEYLRTAGDSITLTWDELDRIVGGLPASATDHQAFWSGDRPHSRAWQRAGFELDQVQRGRRVRLRRTGASPRVAPEPHHEAPRPAPTPSAPTRPNILLVACVKEKLPRPAAARDLYTSTLFRKQRAYAEELGAAWFILSAEHGLVGPDEWLAPYERYLPDTPRSYRQVWGQWVVARLALLQGELRGRVVEVHASDEYMAAIRGPLTGMGAEMVEPLSGLSFGRRLSWYGDPATAQPDVGDFVASLMDSASARTPAQFLGTKGKGLDSPGLYSWWVDAPGAADLSAGLGHQVEAGLLYAGLAGAARAGVAPTSTLWSRISRNHIGGNRRSSTLRKSLAAVLDVALDHSVTKDELTLWMHGHLRLVTAPFPDATTLGLLETDVLARLDPPLNLDKLPPSPLRRRLKQLRATAG